MLGKPLGGDERRLLAADSRMRVGGFLFGSKSFPFIVIYSATCSHCGNVEISKPMLAVFPRKHACGGKLTRRFSMPGVIFDAPGFYATDVRRLESQIGKDAHARFTALKRDAERRAGKGQLTAYEQALEV